MTTKNGAFLQPYLFFEGRTEEALEFYRGAIGAKVSMMMRFKDSPEPPQPGSCAPGSDDKIMHAHFEVGDTSVMVSDGRCSGKPTFAGFSLALNVATTEEADRFFKGLGEGGQVIMPLCKTFFSPSFGMVMDKFGVTWMIMVRP